MPPALSLVPAVSPLACTEMAVCVGRVMSKRQGAFDLTAWHDMVPEVREMTLALDRRCKQGDKYSSSKSQKLGRYMAWSVQPKGSSRAAR